MKSSFKRSFKTRQWITICILTVSIFAFISRLRSQAMAPAYTISDLGTFGGSPPQSRGYGINNCGKAVGDSIPTGGLPLVHPFYKKDAVTPMTDLGTLGTDGTGYSINSMGYTVGYSTATLGQRAILWHDNDDDGVGDPGELQDFFPAGATGVAYDINDTNHVVGVIDTSGGQSFSESPFVWDAANGVQSLPTPPAGMTLTRAVGINNPGNITGWAVVSGRTHAFLLKNNTYTDLGTLNNSDTSLQSFSWRISADDHVVGYSQVSSSAIHPFLWSQTNGMIDLGTVGGTNAYAYDIANGYVVGTSEVGGGGTHAYVWHDDNANNANDPGETKDLNGQFSDPSGTWTTLVEAHGVNDGGQIIGWGTMSNGETHAFLLTPTGFTLPPCPGASPSPSPSPTPATTSLIAVGGLGPYASNGELRATLYSNDLPVSGKTISFTFFGNSVGSAITDASGTAIVPNISLAGRNAGLYQNAVGASFAGDPNYASASTTGTLQITQVMLTITADSKSKTYRATNPALTFTPTGFVNGESSAVLSGAPSLTTTATTTSSVGGYPITITQGTLSATNYSFSFVNGSLTVNKATPVINWTNPSDITYGTGLSSTQLNATATNPNDNSSVTGSFTYNPASATVLHTGNGQTLRADFAPADTLDYNTPVQKTVSINVLKALLTITADNKVKLVGEANPPLTFTPTGFVNGDTSAVLSGSPSLTTTATQSSPVGSYPITITQGTLTASDYAFSFVNGTLVVTEAAPVLLLETGTNNAAAIDSVTFVRGPFSVTDSFNFSGDHVTRIIIFTAPLANPDSTLKVFASNHKLTVENFGSVTGVPGLNASYIVVKLDLVLKGSAPINYDLTVSLRGVTSNTATLTIIP